MKRGVCFQERIQSCRAQPLKIFRVQSFEQERVFVGGSSAQKEDLIVPGSGREVPQAYGSANRRF